MSSSPRSIVWFIDRTGDQSLLDDYYLDNHILDNHILDNHILDNHFINTITTQIIEPLINNIIIIVNDDMEIKDEEMNCCVCQEDDRVKTDICRLNCAHTFCCDCVKKIINRTTLGTCPLCRINIVEVHVQNRENSLLMETHIS